jgi:acetyl esterase/lipase
LYATFHPVTGCPVCLTWGEADTSLARARGRRHGRPGSRHEGIGATSLDEDSVKFRSCLLALLLTLGFSGHEARAAERVLYTVYANETDPGIQRFLGPNWVLYDPPPSATADLLVYLPGTGRGPDARSPFPAIRWFLDAAADQGYRVIALEYDNSPAELQVCMRNPDPSCSADFREKRIFGDDATSLIDDTPAESIVNRLTKLLEYLDKTHPNEGWGAYLDNGAPRWSRIAIAGHSQGAGMAAFLAKRVEVARVILLSGPADFTVPGRVLAPWISDPGATPPDRWYAMYHQQEKLAPLLQRAYVALGIPPDHIRVATLPPRVPRWFNGQGDLYHLSDIGDGTTPLDAAGAPAYLGDWNFLLGHSP